MAEAFRQIAHHLHLLIYVQLTDDSWRGGRRVRRIAEIRALTGGVEGDRPVTHLVYEAPTANSPGIFHPNPELLAELGEFRAGWST